MKSCTLLQRIKTKWAQKDAAMTLRRKRTLAKQAAALCVCYQQKTGQNPLTIIAST
jgi:hypothetical protein